MNATLAAPAAGALGEHLVELRVAAQVDRAGIGDHRVERTVGEGEHLPSGADVESGRGSGPQVGVVDDVADDRRRAPRIARAAAPSTGVSALSGMPLGITTGLTPYGHMRCFMYLLTVVIEAT